MESIKKIIIIIILIINSSIYCSGTYAIFGMGLNLHQRKHFKRTEEYDFEKQYPKNDLRSMLINIGLEKEINKKIIINLQLNIGPEFKDNGEIQKMLLTIDETSYESLNVRQYNKNSFLEIIPSIKFKFLEFSKKHLYLKAGAGIFNYSIEKRAKIEDNSSQYDEIPVNLDSNGDESNMSYSLCSGFGGSMNITSNIKFYIEYLFKYWEPVNYEKKINTEYITIYEVLYSHSFCMGILMEI